MVSPRWRGNDRPVSPCRPALPTVSGITNDYWDCVVRGIVGICLIDWRRKERSFWQLHFQRLLFSWSSPDLMAHTARTIHGDSANASVELTDRQSVHFVSSSVPEVYVTLFIRPLVRCGRKVRAVDAKFTYRSTQVPRFSRRLGSKNPHEKRNYQ